MKIAITLIMLLAVASCNAVHSNAAMPGASRSYTGSSSSRISTTMKTKGSIEGLATFGDPIQIPGADTWLSGFMHTKSGSIFRDSDSFREGGWSGKGALQSASESSLRLHTSSIRWHNAIFNQADSEQQWLLLDRRGFLSRWWMLVDTQSGNAAAKLLIFAATVDDSNGDGYLDDHDASVAIVVGANGRGAKAVTPSGTQLNAIFALGDSELIGFEIRIDENEDGVFARDEPLRIYTMSRRGGVVDAKPWNSAETEARLEAMYK